MFNKLIGTAMITMLLVASVVYMHFVIDSESADREPPFDISSLPPTAAGAGTAGAMDPAGCSNLTNAQLRKLGYEPVTADSSGATDVTAAIQAAIDTANTFRRVVYFRPGTYKISDTLRSPQDRQGTRGQGTQTRYAVSFLGSYCGTEKPTIIMADSVDTRTGVNTVGKRPKPMLASWRPPKGSGPAADTDWMINDGTRNYSVVVRNLKFVTGKNSGVVALLMEGAEQTAYQEVEIDARGAFAGIWSVPNSGGHTYDLEIRGGRFGIFAPSLRDGSPVLVDVKLYEQTDAPIAHGHYAPLNFVGADITSVGKVFVPLNVTLSRSCGGQWCVGSVSVKPESTQAPLQQLDGRWAITFTDSRIQITGGDNPDILTTGAGTVYLRNVYVKGSTNVVDPTWTGDLTVPNNTQWFRIPEYATGRAYNNYVNIEINDSLTANAVWFDGSIRAGGTASATQQQDPPGVMISQHKYRVGVCNPERDGLVDVTKSPYNASPNDSADDTDEIQAAIDAAGDDGMVFLPSGGGTPDGNVTAYKISGTLKLKKNTELCGATQHAAILDASGWTNNSTNKPVIETVNEADAAPIMGQFKIYYPDIGGSFQFGFDPHVYGINWQSGLALYKDVNIMRESWGPQGDRATMIVQNQGGGLMYGFIGTHVFDMSQSQNSRFTNNGYTDGKIRTRDKEGVRTLSSEGKNLKVVNTTNPLNIYKLHCQYVPAVGGAQCEFNNAANVSAWGVKNEQISGKSKRKEAFYTNPAADMPAFLWIKNSNNILLVGAEYVAEPGINRGVVEVFNSTDVTVAGIGSGRASYVSGNWSDRFQVEDGDDQGTALGGYGTLFRNSLTAVAEPPGSYPTPKPQLQTPADFQFQVSTK